MQQTKRSLDRAGRWPDEQVRAQSLAKYRKRAARYDATCRRTWHIRERTVAALHLRLGQCVLDVGCGTGLSLPLLRAAVGDAGRVYGFDQSPEMLCQARVRVAAAGWRNVQLFETPAQALSLPEPVDALLFHYTHDILRAPAALQRLLACARPGAAVGIAGIKYFPRWLAPLNLWVYFKNRGYNGSPGELRTPWDRIAPQLTGWRLTPTQLGMGYIAGGRVAATGGWGPRRRTRRAHWPMDTEPQMAADALPAAGGATRPPYRRIAAAVLALLFLNASLSFTGWWPTPGILPDFRLAPEFVGLWLALLAIVGRRGALSRRALVALALVALLLVLGRYADVTVPSLFGRPINLYWDGAQIPRFLWVSAQNLPWWQTSGVAAGTLLFLWVLYRLLRLGIAVTARQAVPYALRTGWARIATAAAVALVTANLAGVEATSPLVSNPVIPTYWRQANLLATAFSPRRLAQALPPSTALDRALAAPPGAALGALAGHDLYLIMLESYGAVAYDNPKAAQRLAPARAQLAADIAASGRYAVSAFARSPTFGGASDLAHLSVLSGLDLSDPLRHDLLLTTQRPTLITLFHSQGYRTFGLYPALSWQWAERAFYGFDVFLEGRNLDYRGPSLGYWYIPDQFSLARFERMYPRGADAPPRFLFFPTITSHLPFSQTPPYQPDWQRVLTEQPFEEADVERARADYPNWADMFPGYLRMFEYTYRWLGGFLREPEPRDTVFVLIGDHQPTANVSGEGASWDVPVHIVARDTALLARFVALGFHPGLEPPRASIGGLHDLTTLLLKAFAQDESTATVAGAPR